MGGGRALILVWAYKWNNFFSYKREAYIWNNKSCTGQAFHGLHPCRRVALDTLEFRIWLGF